MSAFAKGMNEAANKGQGAMANINAGISNVAGAINEMGADAKAQLEKSKAQATQGMTAFKGMTDNMKIKALDWKTRAQAKIAENAAVRNTQSVEEITKSVTGTLNPIDLAQKAVEKTVDAAHQTGEYVGARRDEAKAGYIEGKRKEEERIAAAKAAANTPTTGGRRRRRRRTRRKKRRKSRKSRRRKRRKSKKKKKRKSRRRRSRRRRR